MKRLYQQLIWIFMAGLLLIGCNSEPEPIPTPLFSTPTANTGQTAVTPPPTDAAETAVATHTPQSGTATPTLAPTPTLMPSATPVTNPPVERVSAAALPPTSRDLLFIADGALKLWNHNNGRVETLYAGGTETIEQRRNTPFSRLVGDVTQFDVSADGNRVAVARLTRMETVTSTVEGTTPISLTYTEHEVLFLDVVSRESWTLAESVSGLEEVAISPDQRQVVFIGRSVVSIPQPSAASVNAAPNVYTVSTPDGTVQQVASCNTFCLGLAWHGESELVAWADGVAVQLLNINGTTPQSILANDTADPPQIRVYVPIAWASNGRYLLLWERQGEGGARVVFDVPSQQLIPVPDSFVYAEPFPTEVQWMPDDRLLLLRAEGSGSARQAVLELWRVDLDARELVREELSQPEVVASGVGARHLQDGRFAYALIHQTNADSSGLYIQTSLSESAQRVNGAAPAFVAPTVVWSPDGMGAILAQNNWVLYAPTDGNRLYDITAAFGQWARDFVWLPPSDTPR